MKIIAIISEYNPFHLGHLYQLNKIKEMFNEEIAIISIMSGNFIQRGEPSIVDKFKRCSFSLECGVNLVFEIPIQTTLSSAEKFAYGSIDILNKLNCVDYVCFGCEDPSYEKLDKISTALLSFNKEDIKKFLDLGVSFAKTQELIIKEKFNDPSLSSYITSPNNILGVEYTKALKILNSSIKILPIKREGGGYNDSSLSTSFSSATSIRNALRKGEINTLENHLPKPVYKVLKNSFLTHKEMMFEYIKYKLLTLGKLDRIEDSSEGLYNKVYKEITGSSSLDELILKVKSKRYPYSKISRMLTKYFIGFEEFDTNHINSDNNYVRVLGFDQKGKNILNSIKKKTPFLLISKFDKTNENIAPLNILSTRAYSLINKEVSPYEDFKRPPIIKY